MINLMIGRNQIFLFQFLHNICMVSCAVRFIPYFVAVKISDYNCFIIKFFYIYVLVNVIFFNIRLAGPNSKQIKIMIYFDRKEIP